MKLLLPGEGGNVHEVDALVYRPEDPLERRWLAVVHAPPACTGTGFSMEGALLDLWKQLRKWRVTDG